MKSAPTFARRLLVCVALAVYMRVQYIFQGLFFFLVHPHPTPPATAPFQVRSWLRFRFGLQPSLNVISHSPDIEVRIQCVQRKVFDALAVLAIRQGRQTVATDSRTRADHAAVGRVLNNSRVAWRKGPFAFVPRERGHTLSPPPSSFGAVAVTLVEKVVATFFRRGDAVRVTISVRAGGVSEGADIVLSNGFEDILLLEDSGAFLVPCLAGAGASRAGTASVAKGADTGLPPVAPGCAAVKFDIATFFATGGAVGASTGVANVNNYVGEEGEEEECNGHELEEVRWSCCWRAKRRY